MTAVTRLKETFLANAYRRVRSWTRVRRDLHGARRRLLSSPDFTPDGFHYLSVGLSANRCIREALRSAGKTVQGGSILDFPSGYGRVLRFLRMEFPDSDITAAETDGRALDFCRRSFDVTPFLSNARSSVLI